MLGLGRSEKRGECCLALIMDRERRIEAIVQQERAGGARRQRQRRRSREAAPFLRELEKRFWRRGFRSGWRVLFQNLGFRLDFWRPRILPKISAIEKKKKKTFSYQCMRRSLIPVADTVGRQNLSENLYF